MRELYCTAVPKNHTIDARRLHLAHHARRHTEAVGLCVACDVLVLGRPPCEVFECFAAAGSAAAVAYVSVIETQARGSLNQHLLLDDGTEAVVLYAAKYMMKTGRRRGGRIESTEK